MAKIRQSSSLFCPSAHTGLLWLVCTLAAMPVAPAAQAASEIVLHNFASPLRGAYPVLGVIRDAAGNLYGTTGAGGPANAGVLYKVDRAGHQTVLHNFTGGADGGTPHAGVIRDSAGNLYGTTYFGGEAGLGVVYKLDTTGHETILHSFTGGADGYYPRAGVIRDSAGNLYGTTCYGGAGGYGVVFRLDPAGNETVLYNFTGGADGRYPEGLIRDAAGNLYGVAGGGSAGAGVVYKLDAAGKETVLYSFTGGADGRDPVGGVIRDTAGNLYGTANMASTGPGVVYKLNTAGQQTVLHGFTGGADGGYPNATLARDPVGNLYGITTTGGVANGGVVFKLDAAGHETVLHNFAGGADGINPYAGVIRDSAGSLYGTTDTGGAGNLGVVYKLDTTGNETVIYTFPGVTDGSRPHSSLVRDSAGNLYGTTESGGVKNAGVVYKMDPAGHETVLYSFTGGTDGGNPLAGVVRDPAGNLYGTTSSGGTVCGTIYKLDPAGHETVLYNFTVESAGCWISSFPGVARDPAGNLYGITNFGGVSQHGIVYKLDPAGNFSTLYNFTGGADGGFPISGVILDPAGNAYGITTLGGASGAGVVFKVDSSGHETVLYSFTGYSNWGGDAGLIRDSAGNLYGATSWGGTHGAGLVFKLDTTGQATVLYNFTGGADGTQPFGGVIRDPTGNLYGTTQAGGTAGRGVVYKVDTQGHETVLYSFTGGADGSYPEAGVIRDPAGNLYGTTIGGGKESSGVVFKIKP